MERFFAEVEKNLGKKWLGWGSEQVTSNFVVANSPRASVLPYPQHANFTPGIPYEQSVLLHFFGSYRFQGGVYLEKTAKVVKKLMSQG